MQDERWQSIPRKDRPTPERLDGYQRKYEYDPDYTLYRRERAEFIYDYGREEEEKRERGSQGYETLPGHEPDEYLVNGARSGFDPDNFDLDRVVGEVKSRPKH